MTLSVYNAGPPMRGDAPSGLLAFLAAAGFWLTLFTGQMCRGWSQIWTLPAIDMDDPRARPPSLLPERARSVWGPRVLLNRSSRRIFARGLPASRCYGHFRHLPNMPASGNGFLERAAKASVNGRARVYRFESKKRLCQSRPSNSPAPLAAPCGLSAGLSFDHLWPA